MTDTVVHDSTGPGIDLQGGTLDLDGVDVLDGDSYGVVIGWNAALSSMRGGLIDGNADAPLRTCAIGMPALDFSVGIGDNGVDEIQVLGGTITSDATGWNYGVPYHVMGDLDVTGSTRRTLTIEDGATLAFDSGAGLTIGDYYGYGRLDAEGTTDGVLFTCADGTLDPGCWNGCGHGDPRLTPAGESGSTRKER